MPPYFGQWVELSSGVTTVLWSTAAILMPIEFSDFFQTVPLARLGTNCQWAIAGTVIGFVQAVAANRNSTKIRWLAASAAFIFWCFLTDGVLHAPIRTPGFVLYAWFAIANLISVMRVLRRLL